MFIFIILILLKFLTYKTFCLHFSRHAVSPEPQNIYNQMVRYNGKDLERSDRVRFRCFPSICPNGLVNTTKDLSQDILLSV